MQIFFSGGKCPRPVTVMHQLRLLRDSRRHLFMLVERVRGTSSLPQVMIQVFGHTDFELILKVYYAQNDDARLVAEGSKIDYGLGLPKTA